MFKNIKIIASFLMVIGLLTYCSFYLGYQRGMEEVKQSVQTVQVEIIKDNANTQVDIARSNNEYIEKILSRGTVTDSSGEPIRLYAKTDRVQDAEGNLLYCSTVDGNARLSRETSDFLIGESIRADNWIEGLQETVKILNKEK